MIDIFKNCDFREKLDEYFLNMNTDGNFDELQKLLDNQDFSIFLEDLGVVDVFSKLFKENDLLYEDLLK